MENIEVYIAAVVTVIAVFGIVWKMTEANKKQIGRMYGRFDEYKAHLEESHVSKEVCGILHNQICEDIVEIKADGKATQKAVNELLVMVKKNGNGK
jgi:hypothetical protein